MAYNKKNDTFALIWAKKIKGINLLGGKCEKCGNNDIFCLEFHHTMEKEFGISDYKTLRWSKLENEIKKCQLLCRNCHAESHCDCNSRRHGQKKTLMEKIGKLKCEKCGYVGKNYASLEFHHLEKSNNFFRISDALYSGHRVVVSVQKLMNEIEKCEVLCSNCHEKKRININRFNELKDIIMQKVEFYKEVQKPLDRELVVKMYDKCKNMHQIAKELKCSRSTISMILKEHRNGKVPEPG